MASGVATSVRVFMKRRSALAKELAILARSSRERDALQIHRACPACRLWPQIGRMATGGGARAPEALGWHDICVASASMGVRGHPVRARATDCQGGDVPASESAVGGVGGDDGVGSDEGA